MTIWSAISKYTMSKFAIASLLAVFTGILGEIVQFAPSIANEGDRGIVCMCMSSGRSYGPTLVAALHSVGLTNVKCSPPSYVMYPSDCPECVSSNPDLMRALSKSRAEYDHCDKSVLRNRFEHEKSFGLYIGFLVFLVSFAIQMYHMKSTGLPTESE